MLVASFLLLASSTSLFTSTFGLTTAASREQPSTLPISSLLHLTTEAASSSQPQEVVIPYGGPMSLPSHLNGILATDPRLRRRNRRRRLRRRGRRRRSRGRRNIQMVSRPWRTTATTSSPMSLYESFGDTQNHVSAYLKIPEGGDISLGNSSCEHERRRHISEPYEEYYLHYKPILEVCIHVLLLPLDDNLAVYTISGWRGHRRRCRSKKASDSEALIPKA